MAITKAPAPAPARQDPEPKPKVNEKKVQEFINQGGGTSSKKREESKVVTKSIKLILTEEEMQSIKEVRDKRPSRSRKIPISVHDWVVEAIQEKLERERKKYQLPAK